MSIHLLWRTHQPIEFKRLSFILVPLDHNVVDCYIQKEIGISIQRSFEEPSKIPEAELEPCSILEAFEDQIPF